MVGQLVTLLNLPSNLSCVNSIVGGRGIDELSRARAFDNEGVYGEKRGIRGGNPWWGWHCGAISSDIAIDIKSSPWNRAPRFSRWNTHADSLPDLCRRLSIIFWFTQSWLRFWSHSPATSGCHAPGPDQRPITLAETSTTKPHSLDLPLDSCHLIVGHHSSRVFALGQFTQVSIVPLAIVLTSSPFHCCELSAAVNVIGA